MSGPWEDYAAQDTGPWNDYAQASNRAQARTWSDVPAAALANAPESAADFASNLYQAVRHPLNTLGNTADVLAGGLRAGAKAVLPEKVFNAIDSVDNADTTQRISDKAGAAGTMLANRYGGSEAIKNTLATDPVGAAADLSAVLTGPEMLAGRVPVASQLATVGRAVDPLANAGRVASAATDFAGNRLANTFGITTGVGTDAIKSAYQAGKSGSQAFLDAIKGKSSAEDVVNNATSSMQKLYQQRGQDYLNNTTGLRNSTAQLDTQPVLDAMVKAEDRFKGQTGFVKDPAAQGTLDNILNTTAEWQKKNPNPTPAAFDELKQAIGVIRDGEKPGTRSFGVADDVYKSIDQQLKTQVPGYADAMKAYADQSNDLQQLSQTLSLKGPKTNVDTAARKLLSGLRDNVNTNFGQRKALLEQLNAQNPDLIPTLAGMSMSSATPRGLAAHVASAEGLVAALHNPALLLGLPLTSPKLVGYGAYGAGRAVGAAKSVTQPVINYVQRRGLLDSSPLSMRINGLLGP